jgi:hypothetical protein
MQLKHFANAQPSTPAHFVEHHSEGVDVTGSGMQAVGQHLWCHECERTYLQEKVFHLLRILDKAVNHAADEQAHRVRVVSVHNESQHQAVRTGCVQVLEAMYQQDCVMNRVQTEKRHDDCPGTSQ